MKLVYQEFVEYATFFNALIKKSKQNMFDANMKSMIRVNN